jgi:recombination protein RecR
VKSILPRAVRDLTQELMSLPGIGPKMARRLSIHLLRQPREAVGKMADVLKNLHVNVRICSRCYNLAEREVCIVCKDEMRSQRVVCAVASPLDVEAIERTGSYDGLYHVLGGVLSPLEGVGVEQLSIRELLERIKEEEIEELILALNPTMESEATVRYIVRHMTRGSIKVSRLAQGLPTGGDIEFADARTLTASFEGRRYEQQKEQQKN